ncbi:MAG TPA: alpha/beta fold hydrolase [Ilumatobacteraceae bacterium]|nr:alpha/beta fold hydrolase [Ilumatobacteraceae bacterium]
MAARAEFLDVAVDGANLGALSWTGLLGAPTVLAVHGITSNAWVWDPLAHHLAGAADLVAVDLRGRGRSFDAPGRYGIEQHAADVASIIDQLEGPLVLLGHSMGAFVVEMVAERRPELVRDLVLVDGGTPLAAPVDGDIDAALHRMLGPDIERIRTIWPDRVSYQAMWAGHPAFEEGIGPDLERNLLADLIEVEDGFRAAVDETAVSVDGHDMLTNDEVRHLLDRRQQPTTIVRAEFGMLGTPPPFITDDVRSRYPQHRWIDAPGRNHYSVLNSAAGASLLAQTLRDILID